MSKNSKPDGEKKMKAKKYMKELRKLQAELCKLQEWVKFKGLRVIIVFEGRDAAGKGGTIKAITERVSPRVFRVIALPAPSDREKSQMYLQRYFTHVPVVGVPVPTSCFKQGRCRECLVEVEEGADCLTAMTPPEAHLDGRFRLPCQARLVAGTGHVRAHTLRRGSMRIESDAQGLADLLAHGGLEPAVTRHGAQVLLDGTPIAEGVASDSPLLGLAADLGTTTIALRLYDLESGAHLASASFENPQRFGGSDVLARIRYDGEHAGRLLQRTLLAYVSKAIAALPCDPLSIYELVVAGNPTMRDLFFGLDVTTIGVLPYRSLTESALRAGEAATPSLASEARPLRLPLHPLARVYGLPLIGSHVGADAAACLLATGQAE